MEFTRPENNVLNLHDVCYDLLVTTTVETESLIARHYVLLVFYNIEFPERYEINNSVFYFALNFIEKFHSNFIKVEEYLTGKKYIRQIETSHILSSLFRLSLEKIKIGGSSDE